MVEFGWSKTEVELRERINEVTTASLDPGWARSVISIGSSNASESSNEFARALAEHRLLVRSWPVEHGGESAPRWEQLILGEVMWEHGEPRGPQYMNVNWIGPAIIRFGTDDQKARFLPPMARGDVVWCQGFSEPDAGSDLASLRTTAVRQGDEYVLNGEKIWTSYASDAQYCFVLARTDPDQRGSNGISIFFVDMDSPGLEVTAIPAIIGDHAFHSVVFHDVRVSAADRLGDENGGWRIVRSALANERVGLPRYIRAAKVLDALAAWAVEHAKLPDSWLEARLGEARAACEAAQLLAYRAIDDEAHDLPPQGNASVARVAIVDAERLVADLAIEAMELAGLADGMIADAQFRNSLAVGIAGGAYEIQLDQIATTTMRLPRS